MGLMQLMPETAGSLGVTDAFDPEQNVMAGARFFRSLLDRYGDVDTALAAYNWGPGNLERGKGSLPQETREYVARVKRFYREEIG
jgi:soluble lytic murein transglycosylase-like protein